VAIPRDPRAQGVRGSSAGWTIGAATTLSAVTAHPGVARELSGAGDGGRTCGLRLSSRIWVLSGQCVRWTPVATTTISPTNGARRSALHGKKAATSVCRRPAAHDAGRVWSSRHRARAVALGARCGWSAPARAHGADPALYRGRCIDYLASDRRDRHDTCCRRPRVGDRCKSQAPAPRVVRLPRWLGVAVAAPDGR